jgi:protein involved in polysaccharide export with SLBB domain
MKYFRLTMLIALLPVSGAFAQAVLRPDDSVEIRLGGVPAEFMQEFSAPYTIDGDGYLNLPYINQVKVGGLSVRNAQIAIETKLKAEEIYTHPSITINMQQQARFVSVGGSVRAPGRVPYTSDLTLLSALNAAGGPSEFAGDKIRLTREGKATYYSTKKLRKDPSKDPKILPGDQVEQLQGWL